MEIKFNVAKDERKALVKAIAGITGHEAEYQGAPGFAFAVGGYTIDRYGAVICGENIGAEDVRLLLTGLTERGFVFEGDVDEIAPDVSEQAEAVLNDLTEHEVIPGVSGDEDGGSEVHDGTDESEPSGGEELGEAATAEADEGSGRLIINMPLAGLTASAFDNLEKLVAAKAWILRKMAEADELPIKRDEKYLRFPWFKPDASAVEVDAYSRLIARLCETAKTKQRVTATERQLQDGDNEKFKARCFLLSLDFIGEEYKQARKILLAPFSGSGSHKAGIGKKTAPEGATAADSGAENPEASGVQEEASGADSADTPSRCGECPHHSYFAYGLLRTKAGDVVDTSKREPEKYTHYCLAAPSGYRKIKHAVDWSGGETPPKWCSLNTKDNKDASDSGNVPTNGGEAV